MARYWSSTRALVSNCSTSLSAIGPSHPLRSAQPPIAYCKRSRRTQGYGRAHSSRETVTAEKGLDRTSSSRDYAVLEAIRSGPLFRFSDWPPEQLPAGPGIYTVWKDRVLVYVGIAGRSASPPGQPPSESLRSRLGSHASGRRSGDQFCLYVCDRLVLPGLEGRLAEIGDAKLSLDDLTRDFIRGHLSFRFASVSDYPTALRLETSIKRLGLGAGRPLLNPGRTPD